MKVKVSEATELQIDWMVTSIEQPDAIRFGYEDWREQRRYGVKHGEFLFRWCTSWAQGGPILERELIVPSPRAGHRPIGAGGFTAHRACRPEGEQFWQIGKTYLIAAMRCHIVSRLGDEAEVPDELV